MFCINAKKARKNMYNYYKVKGHIHDVDNSLKSISEKIEFLSNSGNNSYTFNLLEVGSNVAEGNMIASILRDKGFVVKQDESVLTVTW